MAITTIPLSQIRYDRLLQPRSKTSDEWIEQLRLALDDLPPVIVARGSVLIDGYHRWQAHVREGAEFIDVEDLGDLTDEQMFWEAVERNKAGKLPLTVDDKRKIAAARYETFAPKSATAELAARLGIHETTVRRWTKDARASQEAARHAAAWSLHLDCLTQEQVAADLDVPEKTIGHWIRAQNEQMLEMSLTPPGATDERPWGVVQHFDVWQFQNADKDAGQQSYFGALPPQVVQNLLWLYTEPGHVIVDPFAGSGTTIDVAKAMGRRVWASDICGNKYSPGLPIHQHDITAGWPPGAPAKADLVLLDPPYWRQAEGRYSDDPADLANMSIDAFYKAWQEIILTCSEHLADSGRIAFIISPTQCDDGTVEDHAAAMIMAAHLPVPSRDLRNPCLHVERRIIVPYQTQQATGQQVTWARDNKRLLKLYRDLVVMTR
jgi:hypothetical protein